MPTILIDFEGKETSTFQIRWSANDEKNNALMRRALERALTRLNTDAAPGEGQFFLAGEELHALAKQIQVERLASQLRVEVIPKEEQKAPVPEPEPQKTKYSQEELDAIVKRSVEAVLKERKA